MGLLVLTLKAQDPGFTVLNKHDSTLISALLLAFSAWGQEMTLREVAVPLAEVEGAVWALEPTGEEAEGYVCLTYGDSLVSEIVDGERLWFSVDSGSCRLTGKETELSELMPETEVESFAFSENSVERLQSYRSHGLYSRMFPMAAETELRYLPSRTGLLIIEGDTVLATLTNLRPGNYIATLTSGTLQRKILFDRR